MVVGFHPMGVSHTVVHYPPKEAVTADIILIFHEHSGSTFVDLLTKYVNTSPQENLMHLWNSTTYLVHLNIIMV